MADTVNISEEPRPDNLNISRCHYCNNTAPISKTCTNCHEIKNIDEFYKISNKNPRHRSQCKKCENKKRVLKFKNKGFVNSWYDKKPELLEKVKLLLNIYDKKELFKHVPEVSPWMLSHAIKKNIIQIPIC